jgi:hypothetical protein
MPLPTLLRDPRDRVPVLMTLLPAAALAAWPGACTVALVLWWTGNTVAHQCVHRRFFRAVPLERAFSVWLTLLLGVPQRLWRQRHLAHHAGRAWRLRGDAQLTTELALLATLHATLAVGAPSFCLASYWPGLLGGLVLCALHGWFEHRPGVTDCRARWWNVLFLEDGWHAEHHRWPGRHYTELRAHPVACRTSALPPVLRWLPELSRARVLDALERLVLRSPWLQQRVLAAHRRALADLLEQVPAPREVVVVGGGLWPRSALLLRELLPAARIVVLDADAAHLERARPFLPPGIVLRHGTFAPGEVLDADLVVLPLALRGDRAACAAAPSAPFVLMHDWLWQRRGEGRVVAWWLGKRLNLVRSALVAQPA